MFQIVNYIAQERNKETEALKISELGNKILELWENETVICQEILIELLRIIQQTNIFLQDALDAMKALGLNPGEQEMIDMTNEVNINGLIYYPDFCKLVLRKYREENRETLNQALFKVTLVT